MVWEERRPFVAGGTALKFAVWASLFMVSASVLGWLENGVEMPAFGFPSAFSHSFPRSHFSEAIQIFLAAEVQRLLLGGAIALVPVAPAWVQPIFAVEKPGSNPPTFRLCHDQSVFNSFTASFHFEMEGLDTVASDVQPNDWLCTLDLASAYHSVKLSEEASSFQAFSWAGNFYAFKVLAFGSRLSPFIFTHFIRQVLRHLRHWGVKLLAYLDDFLIRGATEHECLVNLILTVECLTALGFHISWKKSRIMPAQGNLPRARVRFLGLYIDSVNQRFLVPPDKLLRFDQRVGAALETDSITRNNLEKLVGVMGAFSPSNRAARVLAWPAFHALRRAPPFRSAPIRLSKGLREVLTRWRHEVVALNGSVRWKKSRPVSLSLSSDASETGFGGILSTPEGVIPFADTLPDTALGSSSTHRELLGAEAILIFFSDRLAGKSVALYLDSAVAVQYLTKGGGRVPELWATTLRIFDLCLRLDIDLQAHWVPREQNTSADVLSKLVDDDEVRLNPRFLATISRAFGVSFTHDRFATPWNAVARAFDSKEFHVGVAGVDAFVQDWGGEGVNWLNPPFRLIGRTLEHLSRCNARAVLLAPVRSDKPWFPLLTSMAHDSLLLPDAPDVFWQPLRDVPRGRLPWRVAAFLFLPSPE
jgi:hypothetical protein